MKNRILGIYILIIICLVMVISLAGCGTQNAPASSPAASQPVTSSAPAIPPISPVAISSSPIATQPATKTITDMYGRTLTVPTTINRVLASGPIEMELVYLMAPDKLTGLSFTFNGKPALVPDKYAALPVIGGWFGTQTGNYETFIAAKPDIIWKEHKPISRRDRKNLGLSRWFDFTPEKSRPNMLMMP